MLVITRRLNESIQVGDNIRIVILGIEGDRIRIGIEAPASMKILRSELFAEVRDVNREAIVTSLSTLQNLLQAAEPAVITAAMPAGANPADASQAGDSKSAGANQPDAASNPAASSPAANMAGLGAIFPEKTPESAGSARNVPKSRKIGSSSPGYGRNNL